MSIDCQLKVLPEAGTRLSPADRLTISVRKKASYVVRTARKVAKDPMLLWRKLCRLMRPGSPSRRAGLVADALAGGKQGGLTAPGLKPGDKVRVKAAEQIRDTLDDKGRCQGLGYMADVMDKFCGGTFEVKKSVCLFFDERAQRLCKLKNVVILEGVCCEPPKDLEARWAGCDRACFLFWKEAWLERIPSAYPAPTYRVHHGESPLPRSES
jgi:hypothetical protein